MSPLTAHSDVRKNIESCLGEILRHIDGNGKINIHINQVFIAGYKTEDYVRQAFIFMVLSKASYFLPGSVDEQLLDTVYTYIQRNYENNQQLPELDKRFIELFMIRASIFRKKERVFFLEKLAVDPGNLIFTNPLLLHLYLATEGDALKYSETSVMSEYLLPTAKEAVLYSIKSEQKEFLQAFEYVDIFYYDAIHDLGLREKTEKLVEQKLMKELHTKHRMHTSVLAKLFEGYTAICPLEHEKVQSFFKLCLERKLVLNEYLKEMYGYTEDTLVEVEDTSYVCLDAYAHLILGLLNLHIAYEK